MVITDIIIAFLAGIFGAGFGGVQIFVFCAFMVLISAVGHDATGVAFSPVFNPASMFVGAAVGSGYANYKKYNGGGHGAASSLMHLQKPDVLVVGGIAAVFGWICNWALGQLGLAGLDTIATTVIIVPGIAKLIMMKTLTGCDDETIAVGGRFSPIGGRGWCPGMRRGIDKAIWPAAYGAMMAFAMLVLIRNGVAAGSAALIGFGFGGAVLLFPTVPAQHFIGCVVNTAFGFWVAQNPAAIATESAALAAICYGFGFGSLAAHMADLFGDLFTRWSYVHMDIPAGSICFGTLIVALINMIAPALYAGVILLNKRMKPIPAFDKTLIQLGMAATVALPYVLATVDVGALHPAPLALILLLVVGIVHTGVAYTMYFSSMDDIPAQTVALFSYIDPVSAIFLSAIFLKEPLTLFGCIGAVLVLGSTLVSELPERKK